jgi:predicted RNA-binding protein with PUA-like domain
MKMAKPQYWLMKSEPESYSIDQFQKDKFTLWEGVRNYQARNFMTQAMKVGDLFLFYHSNATPPSIVGLGQISKPATSDPSAFNKKSDYYDPKSTPERPIWECVEVQFLEKFKSPFTLEEVKKEETLSKMVLVQKGSRLSIQPVSASEFKFILKKCKSDTKI